jgi:hypothetical protein
MAVRREFFSCPTPELLLNIVSEDGWTACSVRNGADRRDGLVAGWLKTSKRENKERRCCRARKDARLSTGSIDVGLPFYGHSVEATVTQNHPR